LLQVCQLADTLDDADVAAISALPGLMGMPKDYCFSLQLISLFSELPSCAVYCCCRFVSLPTPWMTICQITTASSCVTVCTLHKQRKKQPLLI
jgi:hypothetical protein